MRWLHPASSLQGTQPWQADLQPPPSRGLPGTFQALSSQPSGGSRPALQRLPPLCPDLPCRGSPAILGGAAAILYSSGGFGRGLSGTLSLCWGPALLPSSWAPPLAGAHSASPSPPLGNSSEGPESGPWTGTWRSRQGPSVCHCFPPAKINMRGALDQWFQPSCIIGPVEIL